MDFGCPWGPAWVSLWNHFSDLFESLGAKVGGWVADLLFKWFGGWKSDLSGIAECCKTIVILMFLIDFTFSAKVGFLTPRSHFWSSFGVLFGAFGDNFRDF